MEKEKLKNRMKSKLRKARTPEKLSTHDLNYKKLSEFIELNKQSFEHLENKNYSLAKSTFSKCVEISIELGQIKYIESLINYSLSLYYNNEILSSYNSLKKARDLSYFLYENSEEINQIYFLYLRALCNMCLISMNLNKFEESRQSLKKIISLIKEPKIQDIKIQLTMLKELLYIFYRVDSLDKFHEISGINTNEKYKAINSEMNYDDKGLYYLYKSLENNNLNYWLNYLNKEINNKKNNDINGYTWLLINRIIILYCQKEQDNNENLLKKDYNRLIKLMEEYPEFEIDFDANMKKIYLDFKNKFDIAVEYYGEISNLEKELNNELNESLLVKNKKSKGKENKTLIKLLLKKAIINLKEDNNENKIIIQKHIKTALNLIENNKINWEIISILNINKDLINWIKNLFYGLLIIKEKFTLKKYFHKFKHNTIGETSLKNNIQKNYSKVELYLKNQLKSLEEGSVLIKFNYSSKGSAEHFFRICYVDNEYYLSIHKTISEIKPYKIYNLKELHNITVGIQSENLRNKINNKFLNEYRPYNIMSLWFKERTYDLYFDDDIEMNKWFEAIYYYKKFILGKGYRKNLDYLFFSRLKIKMLYQLKNCDNNLPIIGQLKYYSELNELEYFSLPICKSLLLYLKIFQRVEDKSEEQSEE